LRKDIIELHGFAVNHAIIAKQAIAVAKWAGSKTIQHWAEELVTRIGALQRDTVSANFIDRLVRGAVNLGASRPRLLAAIHCKDASLRNPIGRVSRQVMVNLFAAVEKEFGDPAAGMRLASAARPSCFSDLGFIALFATNIGDMIDDTVGIQGFRQNVWRTSFDRSGNPARLTWHLPDDGDGHLDACIEFSVASYAHLFRSSLRQPLNLIAVRFRHHPRLAIRRYMELLQCPVHFGAEESLIEFDPHQLSLPSPNANPVLQSELMAVYNQPMAWLAAGHKHAAFSYLYLASELNKSPLKLERLAASFALSERTLRRKLVEEGYPFRDLLEKVRRDMCNLYRHEGRRPMGEVAELLGYSELSALTRAHKRWYGQAPTLWAA
jgi:AraC-like DNA-binding protein